MALLARFLLVDSITKATKGRKKNNNHHHTFSRTKKMRRSRSKTPSASKRPPSGPRVDWVPPHPALGAQVIPTKTNDCVFVLLKEKYLFCFFWIVTCIVRKSSIRRTRCCWCSTYTCSVHALYCSRNSRFKRSF